MVKLAISSCIELHNSCTFTDDKDMRETTEDKKLHWGFPGGAAVKNPPANVGDTGSSPGLGRPHMPRSN